MRLFPVVKATSAFFVVLLVLASASVAYAQQDDADVVDAAGAAAAAVPPTNPALAQALAAAAQGSGAPVSPFATAEEPDAGLVLSEAELKELLKDPDSAQFKAHALADHAKRTGGLINFARSKTPDQKETLITQPTPPEVDALQNIHAAHGTRLGIADELADEELLSLDIRRDAQKEAALSYGARGGLAKRNYQIAERLSGYEDVLDRVFNFRALLVRAPSGLLIEPPIVRESLENILINSDGTEAAVADRILDINKQAKIVSAPRDWRHYISINYESEIQPPPRVLWPMNKEEQAEWNGWVKQGWLAGYEQGEETFETNLNRLVTDYSGMVRYRMLLTQGMISQPFAMHEDRGVTGDKTVMRVGDRALRITGPSQFLTGSDLWKPADR